MWNCPVQSDISNFGTRNKISGVMPSSRAFQPRTSVDNRPMIHGLVNRNGLVPSVFISNTNALRIFRGFFHCLPIVSAWRKRVMTLPTAAYDAHQPPTPPPPRPPRPAKVPGYLFTAASSTDAAQWLQQQVFYTHDRALMLSIRHKQPVFLLDAEAQQLHGVFQRTLDTRVLQQDLTQAPGPQGFKVHVVPLYEFPVNVDLDSVDDLLVCSRQHPGIISSSGSPGTQSSSSSSLFEPVLGSFQHGYLWEAFMKKAKKAQHRAMECIEETEQQLQALSVPPPPPPRQAAAVANGLS